jgi:hypothetical protein
MLHLSNILGVRNIAIYRPNFFHAVFQNHEIAIPCMGIGLENPDPKRLSETIHTYFKL